MAQTLAHHRPNWLLRGLVLASALFHLGLILHMTGVLRVETYTRIEVKMAENQPPARALPRPRPRPTETREPSAVNPLDVPRAAPPTPQPREAPIPQASDLSGEAWAPPKVAALPAGGFLPAGAGLGGAEMTAYQEMVRARIERNKAYPTFARQRQQEGRVVLVFTIDAKGKLLSLQVQGSSGTASLDQAAQDAVRKAAPFPPPPGAGPDGLRMRLTIAFELS